MLKKSLLVLATLGSALPAVSFAQDASPLSFNLGAVTDYRYRGISQTRFEPALQFGADLALPAGFYIGTWGSTIKWIRDSGGDSTVEIDVYAGWKKEVVSGLTLDVGVLQYIYPDAETPAWSSVYDDPNTTEVYGAVTYGPATLKYSHSTSNLFGNRDSKGSGYLDLSATFSLPEGFSLTPHVGYQKVKGYTSTLSYTDYSLTLSKDISGTVVSLSFVGTNTKTVPANINGHAYYDPSGANLGKDGVFFGIKRTF
ncbi:TorF family putative porin [Piscinibacter sp. HJYY11]|uniref:TorF family putative porin n=1 Tax=Piscinibacter sp. HJYY11 TaxID=2801333 RepID=UPI00191F559C|nr:TorF family putative porin [Piscinibacter sp. HJYY11]MBL0729402.1 hypothetical protein [Piscinibacter sp. HJYY11]